MRKCLSINFVNRYIRTMNQIIKSFVFGLCSVLLFTPVEQRLLAQEELFEQNIADSDALRVEQAEEIEQYINDLAQSQENLLQIYRPNFDSESDYVKSVEPYRNEFKRSIGYPPPQLSDSLVAKLDKLGEDNLGTYYRLFLPTTDSIHVEGIYIVPKSLQPKYPLVISMHGGGGSPERALFHGGANYHDMVRGAVRRGYAVFAPQHLFSSAGLAKDVRVKMDQRLRLVGTSITAIEIAKIVRSIDYLTTRDEVDASKIGMVGLSYGGFYTLATMAVDHRIIAGASSCYFGVQEGRFNRDQNSVPFDFQFMNRFTLFRDENLVALICPRAIHIQAGSNDGIDHREPGRVSAATANLPFERLKISDKFEHVIFEGGHEFHDDSAWKFIDKYLR